MNLERLRQDLKWVRKRGIPRTRLGDVPSLDEALALRRPDVDDAARGHLLEELLSEAAQQLDDHDRVGVQLAFGIGGWALDPDGRVWSSAGRRAQFAAHYGSVAETVRRKGGLEDQVLMKLAKVIAGEPTPRRAATPGTSTSTSGVNEPLHEVPSLSSIPTITSRARAYYAIDCFEQDLRHLVDVHLLDHLSPEEAFGAAYGHLAVSPSQSDAVDIRPDIQYLDPHHAYGALVRNADSLPEELAPLVQLNLPLLDRFLPVSNRVMRGRPLQPEDLDVTESFIRLFQSEHFSQTRLAITQLSRDLDWQPRRRPDSQPPERILHNLPAPDFDETGLLGREEQVGAVVRMLKRGRVPITLIGEGGIGKTSLALEVCFRLADDPEPCFDAILWTSLKRERLTPSGIQELSSAVRDISSATRELGRAVDPSFNGSARELADLLGGMRTLIVIDNLETAVGNEVVELWDTLPETVTFLFTSRVGVGQIERTVDIGPLEVTSAVALFDSFARDRGQSALVGLGHDKKTEILERLRCSPLAIRWYILSVEAGRAPGDALRNQDALLRFCVENVVDGLGREDRRLLDVLRVLDRPVLIEELAVISEMDIDTLRRSAHRLFRSSLLVWSQTPAPEASDVEADRLALSSTARAFLRTTTDAETSDDVIQRDIAYNQEREQERERIADHGRYLDQNVIFERPGGGDAPTAHLLKQALRENKAGHPEAAAGTLARARAINPGYFEVDRVAAVIAGYGRQTAAATALYRSALSSCEDEEQQAWVGHFFATHLARQVHDISGAIRLAEKAHEMFDTYDTALQLGNFYVWDLRFEDGRELIESAIARAPGKPRFERIATTSLVECLRRWSESSLAREPEAALDRAVQGTVVGLTLHDAGSTDEQLMGAIVLAAVAGLLAARRQAVLEPTRSARLAKALQRISADSRFRRVSSWRALERAVNSISTDLRSSLAPGFATSPVEPMDPSAQRLLGSVTSLHEKFGFIAHRDFPNNVFFHRGSLRMPTTMADLEIGALVEFTPAKNEKGQDQAVNVVLMGPPGGPDLVVDS